MWEENFAHNVSEIIKLALLQSHILISSGFVFFCVVIQVAPKISFLAFLLLFNYPESVEYGTMVSND